MKGITYIVAIKDWESCLGEWCFESLKQAENKYESIKLKKGQRKYLKNLNTREYLKEEEIEKQPRYVVELLRGNNLLDEWYYSEEELDLAKERYELTDLEQGQRKIIKDLKENKII